MNTNRRVMAVMLSVFILLSGCALSEDAYVRLPQGVSADMLQTEYWLRAMPYADDVIMSTEDIIRYSQTHANLVGDADGVKHALTSIGDTMDGGALRRLLESLLIHMPEDHASVYLNGQSTTAQYWRDLIAMEAMDQIPDTVTVRYGYSVRRASLRMYPSDDFIGTTAGDTFYDEIVCSELLPFLPLCKVHESADGQWWYVILYGMSGWVKKECVALCDTREDWLARQEERELLIVTGRELRLASEPLVPELSELILPMGTRLPLLSSADAPRTVNGRATYGSYVVKLPTRAQDGRLADTFMLIPVSDDVSVGFLPYTRGNVIRQAMKLLGDRYGWAGMFLSNDCSGIVHEIFACFGFVLPRTAGAQANAPGMKTMDISGLSDTEKLSLLDTVPAGALLNFPGHIMIYMGKADGVPYVISAAGSAAVTPGEGTEHVSAVTLNSLYTCRRNGSSWLRELAVINWAQPQ